MNRRYFQSRRVLPPLEMELPQQISFRPVHRPLQTRAPVMNLQNNRIRRPFIRRPPPPPPQAAPQNIPHAPCRFCYNLVPRDSYSEHLTHCPVKLEAQQRDAFENQQMEIEPQRNQEEPAPQIIAEQEGVNTRDHREPQQLADPQEVIDEEAIPDAQDDPAQNPFPVFSGATTTVYNSQQDTQNIEAQSTFPSLIQHSEPSLLSNIIQQQEIQQVQNQPGHLPPGSFVLRTVEPGPDGVPSTRTRVISLDNILGGQAGEGGENQRPRILGLLSMLAGLQGARAAQLAAFLGLFGEERGLGKDVLDSLPIVIYTEEGFKNVDEESKKCSICLDDYEEQQEVRFLWCMHRFHKNCVDQWLERHTSCPFCKKDYAEALRFGENAV